MSHAAKVETILTVMAEGGSLDLYGRKSSLGEWQFSRHVDDWTPLLLDEARISHTSTLVDSWDAALKLLDNYPWFQLVPRTVHPEFAERIWQAFSQRWKTSAYGSEYCFERWQAACGQMSKAGHDEAVKHRGARRKKGSD